LRTNAKFCGKCGTRLATGDQLCQNCGKKFRNPIQWGFNFDLFKLKINSHVVVVVYQLKRFSIGFWA